MAFPTPTAIAGTVPYFKGTQSEVLWVPTIASGPSPAAPTAAEITAGKNITKVIMSISGFELSTASLELNLLGGGFTGSVPGRTSAGDASIMFELSASGPANTSDVRSFLTANLTGFVLFANEGFTTGMAIDVWPVRIGAYSPPQDTEAIAGVNVPFFTYAKPTLNLTIPTV